MSESKGLQINWLAASGSALGAVTSAVLLSTLGAAGTLIGAALGSLIITVGGSVYSYSLERAKSGLEKTAEKVKTSTQVKKTASQKTHEPITASSDRQDMDVTSRVEAVKGIDDESDDKPEPKEKGSWKQALRGMSWKRVGLLAAGLFALTMVIILVFEFSTGRPVSSYTGGTSSDTTGTTFSSLTNRGGDRDSDEDPGTGTPGQEDSEHGPVEQDNDHSQPYEEDQDVEQDQPQYESPEMQDDPAPEEQPVPEEEPQQQEEQQPAPQQEEAPVDPAE